MRKKVRKILPPSAATHISIAVKFAERRLQPALSGKTESIGFAVNA